MNTKGSQDIEQTMFSAFDKLHFVFLCNEHSRLTSVNVMNFLGQAPVVQNLNNAIYQKKNHYPLDI